MLTITQLLTPLTSAQVRAKFVSMLNTLGIPADQWRQGGTLSTMLTIVSMTYANFTQIIVDAIGSQFLGTATGDWLTLLAQYVYNVQRAQATFAAGSVTLTNAGGGVFNFNPGGITVQNLRTGKTYTNTVAVFLGSLSTLTTTFQAVTAGSASNANPGDITVLVTQMLGVSVTNTAAFVGLDTQSDASLVATCQAKLGSLTNGGPSNAYQYAVDVAVDSISGAPVNVNRRNVHTQPLTGVVNVIVASPSGSVTSTNITGIINSIVALAVPDAVTFFVQSANPVSYSPTVTVWAEGLPGISASALQTQINTAISNYISNYPIGGLAKAAGASKLWATGLSGAVEEVSSAIFAVDGFTDLTLNPADVATDSVPPVTVNLVNPP